MSRDHGGSGGDGLWARLRRIDQFLGNNLSTGRLPRANQHAVLGPRHARRLVEAIRTAPEWWVALCSDGAVQAPASGPPFAVSLAGRAATDARYGLYPWVVLAFDDSHLGIVQFGRPNVREICSHLDVERRPFTVDRSSRLIGGPTGARLLVGGLDPLVDELCRRGWLDPARVET
jgi:hypothetical protein